MAKKAAKAPETGAESEPLYDVAISFLAKDEATARALADKLEASGFRVFFFPRNQEELAGTNGMETMRTPFFSSRVNAVLFGDPWGKTPWTGVEQTAITERCLETGWDSLIFVQLDSTSTMPKWLPKTHVRFALEAYGLEQLAGAIKARVQEHGGIVRPPDAMTEARRVKRQADYLKDREALMKNQTWIEQHVHRAVRATFERVEQLVAKIKEEHGFVIEIASQGYQNCIIRTGYVTLGLQWNQPIYNSIANDRLGDCYLRVTEFSGLVPIPGRNEMSWYRPRSLREQHFKPDVSETRELVWVLGKERIAPDALADRIVMILMDLIDRMNRGKIPRPDE